MLKRSIGIKLFKAITGEEEIIAGKSTGGGWYGIHAMRNRDGLL